MATRQLYPWSVTAESGEVLDEGTQYAHNSALEAGTAAVRRIARDEGQLYARGQITRTDAATSVGWAGERDSRALVVTVRRPS